MADAVSGPSSIEADARQPEQLGDQRPQRMPAVHVIAAVGGHDGQPLGVQHPAQEGDQVPGGLVGPVQVLEYQQHRAGAGQLGQHPEHRAEQLLLHQARHVAAGRLALVAVRQQPGQHRPGRQRVEQGTAGRRAGRRVPQRVGERQVRHGVAELGAAAGQDGEALLARPRGQLGDQPGLAHASVAADQGDDRPARAAASSRREQVAELGFPADQLAVTVLQAPLQYHSRARTVSDVRSPPRGHRAPARRLRQCLVCRAAAPDCSEISRAKWRSSARSRSPSRSGTGSWRLASRASPASSG